MVEPSQSSNMATGEIAAPLCTALVAHVLLTSRRNLDGLKIEVQKPATPVQDKRRRAVSRRHALDFRPTSHTKR